MATTKSPEEKVSSALPMTAAMMAVSPAATKAWLDVVNESSRFVMDRLQQDLQTQKAIMACKSPVELMQVQAEFYQHAVQQYAEEAQRMFRMMSEATKKSVDEARSSYSRAYDDVPL